MKTYHTKSGDIKRSWHLIDAKDQVLGRMATVISTVLMGKNKVSYSPHMDAGDYVVVINAKDVKLTGMKPFQKTYARHSGYPGGLRVTKFAAQMEKDPRKVIESAVLGMLPDNRLQAKRIRRLKVFPGSEHTYIDKFSQAK